MKIEKTERGFGYIKFLDRYDVECSLQESSLATEACIWLGCNKIGLKKFTPGEDGWQDIELEQNPPYGIVHNANTRMHLTQDNVRDLLPALEYFVKNGTLPEK